MPSGAEMLPLIVGQLATAPDTGDASSVEVEEAEVVETVDGNEPPGSYATANSETSDSTPRKKTAT